MGLILAPPPCGHADLLDTKLQGSMPHYQKRLPQPKMPADGSQGSLTHPPQHLVTLNHDAFGCKQEFTRDLLEIKGGLVIRMPSVKV